MINSIKEINDFINQENSQNIDNNNYFEAIKEIMYREWLIGAVSEIEDFNFIKIKPYIMTDKQTFNEVEIFNLFIEKIPKQSLLIQYNNIENCDINSALLFYLDQKFYFLTFIKGKINSMMEIQPKNSNYVNPMVNATLNSEGISIETKEDVNTTLKAFQALTLLTNYYQLNENKPINLVEELSQLN